MLAKAKYAEAGEILHRDGERLRSAAEKHLQQFLSATQYYLGGHYRIAHDMARRIEARFLTPHVASLLPKFLKDAKTRSSPDYEERVRKSLKVAYENKKSDSVISILQHHPYVLDSVGLSFLRAVSCEHLGKYRAAALFYRAACRHLPSDVELLLGTIIYPLRLPSQGRLDEAWEYAQHQVELLPHPITFITASNVCHRRGFAANMQESAPIFRQQIEYLDKAWEGYQRLAERDQSHPEVKPYISFGLVMGAHTLLELGEIDRAKVLCDAAIKLTPNAAAPWTIRGLVTEPSDSAIDDLKKATTLPDATHIPYAKLAEGAWKRRDIAAASQYCQAALQRNARGFIAGKLYGWLASCKAVLGATHAEVVALFKKAIELAPGDSEVSINYTSYLERTEGVTWQPDLKPDLITNVAAEIVSNCESHFSRNDLIDLTVNDILQRS